MEHRRQLRFVFGLHRLPRLRHAPRVLVWPLAAAAQAAAVAQGTPRAVQPAALAAAALAAARERGDDGRRAD